MLALKFWDKAKRQKKKNAALSNIIGIHGTVMSDHWKNPSGSLCAILFHFLNLERIASHRGTCSNKGSSTDFNTDSWLSWNSPKGRWNTDSHNWPFFSSHVTISMSLWLFASLPKFLLMTVDCLQQNWVFSQSLEIFIWQQQCCVMAVTKMDIKICKPENYMYSWSTLSILILKISIMKTKSFCTDFGELWNRVQWLSNIFQGHVNSKAPFQGVHDALIKVIDIIVQPLQIFFSSFHGLFFLPENHRNASGCL